MAGGSVDEMGKNRFGALLYPISRTEFRHIIPEEEVDLYGGLKAACFSERIGPGR